MPQLAVAPPPPKPNRQTLTRQSIDEISAFHTSGGKTFPIFAGSPMQQATARGHFKRKASRFFIAETGPLKGVLCTTFALLHPKGIAKQGLVFFFNFIFSYPDISPIQLLVIPLKQRKV